MENLKKTKSREQILKVVSQHLEPVSANEIFEELKDADITLSTIYRTLNSFAENGILHKEVSIDNVSIYSMANEEHCHYLECRECHKKIKINYCPYNDKVLKKIKKENGFTIDEHKIVYGICPDCQRR